MDSVSQFYARKWRWEGVGQIENLRYGGLAASQKRMALACE